MFVHSSHHASAAFSVMTVVRGLPPGVTTKVLVHFMPALVYDSLQQHLVSFWVGDLSPLAGKFYMVIELCSLAVFEERVVASAHVTENYIHGLCGQIAGESTLQSEASSYWTMGLGHPKTELCVSDSIVPVTFTRTYLVVHYSASCFCTVKPFEDQNSCLLLCCFA